MTAVTSMTPVLLAEILPSHLRSSATQELADLINQMNLDTETLDEVRGNLLTYSKVMQEGKYKLEDYLNATVYVTHKLMGYNNREAYVRTFPDRYQALVAKGATEKDISAYVAAYHRGKLVNQIMEKTLIPIHVLYQDAFHAALRKQLQLMDDPNVSFRVQREAADSVLQHTRPPEVKHLELKVGLDQENGLGALKEQMNQLAATQKKLIEEGHMTSAAVAGTPLKISQAEKDAAIDA